MMSVSLAILVTSAYAQCAAQRITGPDNDFPIFYGGSVAVSSDFIVVGALWDSYQGEPRQGSASVLARSDPTGRPIAILHESELVPKMHFGRRIALGSDRIIVSSTNGQAGEIRSGSVLVFTEADGKWISERLLPKGIEPNGAFGAALATDGRFIVVGDTSNSSGRLGKNSGRAWIFERVDDRWVETIVDAPEGHESMAFGRGAAMSGDVMVIGASVFNEANLEVAGAAFVYQLQDGKWVYSERIHADDPMIGDAFGYDVATDGTRIIAGARQNLINQPGRAFVFCRGADGWEVEHTLRPETGNAEDQFGLAVDIEGTRAVVGMPFADHSGPLTGRVYLYDLDRPECPRILEPIGTPAPAAFGWSVALHGDTLVVGSPREDVLDGAAYVYDLSLIERCPTDIDLDCQTAWRDVLRVLMEWGGCGASDVDRDGTTDTADLLAVFSAWGACSE